MAGESNAKESHKVFDQGSMLVFRGDWPRGMLRLW